MRGLFSHRGPTEDPRTEDQLVAELVSIAHSRGFLRACGGAADGDTVRIGRLLDARGGMPLMRKVHAAVTARVARPYSRELVAAWDGIGDWRVV